MPLDERSSAIAESWEAEDPLTIYKEAHDPYEGDLLRPLRQGLYVVRDRRTNLAQRFQRSDAEVADLFSSLASEWREATAIESNLEHIILNSAYQRVIGLGSQVLPYILKDLDETSGHWFWALMAIVGEDKAAGQTSVGAAAEAWLAWGRSIGILDA